MIIGFEAGSVERSLLWKRHILSEEYDLDMASNGDVIGAEVVIMADQVRAAEIADLAPNLVVYEKHGGTWTRRKPKGGK